MRNGYLVLLCTILSSAGLSNAAVAASQEELLENLDHPDPFLAELAAAEIEKLGSVVLPALAQALGAPDVELRFKVDQLFNELIEEVFVDLETEYRSLDLDRRELASKQGRETARKDLVRLEKLVDEWKKSFVDFDEKVNKFLAFKTLEKQRQNRDPDSDPDSETARDEKLSALKKEIEQLEEEIPDLEAKVTDVLRHDQLESVKDSLKDLSDVEKLRMQELEERVESREPAVEGLLEKVAAIGPPAYAAMAARLTRLPLKDLHPTGKLRSSVQVLYDDLIAKALKGLAPELWAPNEEDFDRVRYQVSLLWAKEVQAGGPHKDEAEMVLSRHVTATLSDLDAPVSIIRERAATELYRQGQRGLDALLARIEAADASSINASAGDHAFLAGLLRWKIAPSTYARFGVHFAEYENLSFTARRRKIFQYARTAGGDAIPTLRAVVVEDSLESSFLVKYAAAKALAVQLEDHLGYMVLKSLHPAMVMKRPKISRGLRLVQGRALIETKDYQLAVEEFAKILEALPFDFEGNYWIAFTYLLLKDYPKAIHHFEIARRINPKDYLTLYNLACAYSLGGKPKQALDALGAAVDAGFDDAQHIEKDPDLDPIRTQPRYQRIVDKARAAEEESQN